VQTPRRIAALVGAVIALTIGSATALAADTGPLIPYTAGSYLTSAPGPVDATLTAQMRAFIGVANKNVAYPKLNGLGSNKWGMVYRQGVATDPVWKLTGKVPTKVAFLATIGFHAPADLCTSITGTSDSPMVVMDVASGFTVMATKVACGATPNTVAVAGSSAAFFHSSNGLDGKRIESTDKRNLASRGRIPDSMVIRKDRLDWAVANGTDLGYVLEIFWPETDSSAGFRFPMTGAEGSKTGWGAEGQRISIDPAVDLSTRNCTPYAYAIALTLQRHGAYIGDNAGSGAALKMEQDSTAHPVWHGAIKQTELAGCVTWADFVANVTPK
jgi:hypothetical protein